MYDIVVIVMMVVMVMKIIVIIITFKEECKPVLVFVCVSITRKPGKIQLFFL